MVMRKSSFRCAGILFHERRVGEVAAEPGTGDAVGQRVVADVGPAHFVGLGEAAPGHAVEFAGLNGDFDVVPRHGHRNQAVLGQELARRRHAEDALAVHVGEALDRLLGEDVERDPRHRRRARSRSRPRYRLPPRFPSGRSSGTAPAHRGCSAWRRGSSRRTPRCRPARPWWLRPTARHQACRSAAHGTVPPSARAGRHSRARSPSRHWRPR